ncbi:myelin-oligodendrocyte glycoprotein-like, partial [Engraulis encrasicolus]|uniref:myelin-oligodendrocyte glycoprotein-like n=1 Tax=Engraulis encrasicolus TaxID=184585 RepID=UPI002FD25015
MATGGGFKLLIRTKKVWSRRGDDVTLGCHLSPATSAVAMEIRWFRWTDCIYLYRDGHVTVRGEYEDRWGNVINYEGRVSVDPQQLQTGDVSLKLKGFRWEDVGYYTCQVISGEHTHEGRVKLNEWV